MALSLITNIGSLIASNALTNNQTSLNTSIAQLSTGKRITSAADDPGGLSIATETSGLLGALNQATSNATNAQAFLQTADGALSNIGNLLQTAQQLATEAADGSYNSTQLTSIDSQYQAILTSINQIANGASFNGISLLTGTSVTFQVGATNTANDQLAHGHFISKADTTTLAGQRHQPCTSQANAQAALTKVTTALATIAGDRATVGSAEQSLTAVSNNLQSTEQNLTSALSNIQDTNVAQTLRDLHQRIGVATGGCAGVLKTGRTDAVTVGSAVPSKQG